VKQVRPALAGVAKSRIRLALGVSEPYSSDIRTGKRIPHPRQWQTLAQLGRDFDKDADCGRDGSLSALTVLTYHSADDTWRLLILTLSLSAAIFRKLGRNMVLAANQAARILPSRYVTEPNVAR
jgi:hypothetical protein